MEIDPVLRFAALAHPQRLAAFRLLVRRAPDAVPAGEIARALALPGSTLSPHLAQLRQAGLVSESRQGASRRYRADLAGAGALARYLLGECCRGRVSDCLPELFPAPPVTAERRPAVLFLCSGNSARSIFAEAILRRHAGDRFLALSAGTRPNAAINPIAREMLRDKGHDLAPLRAKHVSEFQGPDAPRIDFVFTVCDRAANEECPAWPGQPVTAHWGQPDPAQAEGSEAERRLAFQRVYGALHNRIALFAALPLATLDRAALQARLDEIAQKEIAE
ncbi:metalloregulator ArsR/SmtB family transcription factor [Roseivivax sp. CAU 1761]